MIIAKGSGRCLILSSTQEGVTIMLFIKVVEMFVLWPALAIFVAIHDVLLRGSGRGSVDYFNLIGGFLGIILVYIAWRLLLSPFRCTGGGWTVACIILVILCWVVGFLLLFSHNFLGPDPADREEDYYE